MEFYKTSNQVNYGRRIIPLKMIEHMSFDDWEVFIEEWVDIKKVDYLEGEQFGGAGDKGRDVVGYVTDKNKPNYVWDCFQCKHYSNALTPSDVYKEFIKILFHTFNQEYPTPRKYYFISPKGCGTSLSKLLLNPKKLKDAIVNNWSKHNQIDTTKGGIQLKGKLLSWVNDFDYSIFSKIHTKDILKEHKKHPNHIIRFGGGLPEREKLDINTISDNIKSSETTYVSQLLSAYSSESKEIYKNVSNLDSKELYKNHFTRARMSFHHAEQLRNFSRDSLPVDTFDDFQKEIFEGIVDIVEDIHSNSFIKVKEVEKEASKVIISSNPLKDVSLIYDKKGICHQLVNDNKIKWT
ncbi:ABC-three component system protein [Tenacibaculum piscium]|uniref:ABC-three component system protein n=1 Tax=Tenacibaculum piscium TaxID=1458515 RepID=UPI001F2AFEDF|nr:ABC-three component system protein [Tenacibaculum piscium]